MYKICFESEGKFDDLKKYDIEVQTFEEDKETKFVYDQEDILKRNYIEELL